MIPWVVHTVDKTPVGCNDCVAFLSRKNRKRPCKGSESEAAAEEGSSQKDHEQSSPSAPLLSNSTTTEASSSVITTDEGLARSQDDPLPSTQQQQSVVEQQSCCNSPEKNMKNVDEVSEQTPPPPDILSKSDSGFSEKVKDSGDNMEEDIPKKQEMSSQQAHVLFEKRFGNQFFEDSDLNAEFNDATRPKNSEESDDDYSDFSCESTGSRVFFSSQTSPIFLLFFSVSYFVLAKVSIFALFVLQMEFDCAKTAGEELAVTRDRFHPDEAPLIRPKTGLTLTSETSRYVRQSKMLLKTLSV